MTQQTSVSGKIKTAVFVGLVVLAIAVSYLRVIDAYSSAYHDQALKQAALTYAAARGINALVSMLQTSTIEGGAVFVTGSVTIGELLDPVNDLIERFSTVMTLVLGSLAAQKLLMTITGHDAFLHLLLFSGLLLLGSVFLKLPLATGWLFKFFVVTLCLRFFMVMVLSLNAMVDRGFLWQETVVHDQGVRLFQDEIGPPGDNQSAEASEAEGAKGYVMQTKDWIAQLNFDELEQKVEKSIDDFIMLMAIYLVKTILLPLLFLYGFFYAVRHLWSWNHRWLYDQVK